MNGFGKLLGVFEIRLAGFAPHEVGHFRIRQPTRDGLLQTRLGTVEAFDGALAGAERLVVLVHIGGQQVGSFRVGTGDQHGRHAHHVGSQTRGDELAHGFTGRHQNLAAHVAALLHGGQLVLKVHAGRTGLDHGLHQFERVQHAAETGFCIGHDRGEEVDVVLAFRPLDLVSALERVVDLLDDLGHRIHRVQRLIRIHLAVAVGITRNLPARQIDRLQTSLDLLHSLVARQCAQGVDEGFVVDQVPQLFGTTLGQRVFNLQRTTQAHDIFSGVTALDALPTRVGIPFLLQLLHFEFA